MTKHNDNHAESVAKVAGLIKGIKVAMLTTITDDGVLRSRPMATLDRPFDGELWFFTEAGAPKVSEIEREHEVNLGYADPSDNRYVSVSGRAQLVHDSKKIEALWSPGMKAFFPKGKEDPNLALLRIDVDSVEYWSSPSGAVVKLVGFAKALLTGKRYDEELADHEKLEIK
jgi:general stress protein 26